MRNNVLIAAAAAAVAATVVVDENGGESLHLRMDRMSDEDGAGRAKRTNNGGCGVRRVGETTACALGG
jgi:hypothetical protein